MTMKLNHLLFSSLFILAPLLGLAQVHSDKHHKTGKSANEYMHQRPVSELIKTFESPERDEWQKPEEVIAFLGNLEGKKVMDIGAGSGYFSFRLAEAGAAVIAADVNEEFQAYIQKKKQEKDLSDQALQTRLILFDDPQLAPEEVDMVLVVDTYHHIDNRIAYLDKIKKGLKKGGRLVIIDFFAKETPQGPPLEHRISANTVWQELKKSGYALDSIETALLPNQYIIIATPQ